MLRVLQLVVGLAGVLIGLGLGALVVAVWWPCAGVQPPIDHLSTPRPCVEVTSGTNTAWIGLLLWPLALALAGFAAVRTVARYGGAIAWAVVIVLAGIVLLTTRERRMRGTPVREWA